jgi:hypothetical protein
MAQQLPELNPIYGNRLSPHRARVALATGLTIAALIGSQTLAVLDRTVSAKPVQIGHPTVTPAVAGTPVKPGKKPKASATPAPSLNISADDNPTAPAGPSLNISDNGGIQPAPQQPAPFSLSSR